MTTLEVKLELPEQMARAAEAAGLLTPKALRAMLRAAMRRHAADQLLRGATKSKARPLSMSAVQREVAAVRRSARRSA